MAVVENKGLPRFLLGNAHTVTITPQTVSSAGVFSDKAIGAMSFYGRIEDDSFEHSLNVQNFPSVTSFQANPVPMEYSATYTITELSSPSTLITTANQQDTNFWCSGNILESALRQGWYHKIVITTDDWYPKVAQASTPMTPTTIMTYTFYALMTNMRHSRPKGKQLAQATFQLVSVSDGAGGYADNPQMS